MTIAIRQLVLALCLATLALVALQVGSAGATVLCQEAPSLGKCPKGKTYAAGQKFQFAAAHNVFTDEEYFCEASETEIELTAAGGAAETAKGKVLSWTFSKCSLGEINCTVEAESLPYLAEFHWTAGGDGDVVVESSGEGEPFVFVTCFPGLIECGFAEDLELELTGGEAASLRAEEARLELKEEFGLVICPPEVEWDATLQAKAPTAIWMAKE